MGAAAKNTKANPKKKKGAEHAYPDEAVRSGLRIMLSSYNLHGKEESASKVAKDLEWPSMAKTVRRAPCTASG